MSYQEKREFSLLHADVCQALADPKRILILYALSEKPRHVTALAEDLGIPQPTVSRHLRILRQQSLVTTERDGPSVIYHLADDRVIAVLDLMEQIVFDTLTQRSDLAEAHVSG
ncbi:MAG: ArsR/SmtB family transcription factor [Candidatus Promineifilaceae bacterium]